MLQTHLSSWYPKKGASSIEGNDNVPFKSHVIRVGEGVGTPVGDLVGTAVGESVGTLVGAGVVGLPDGVSVGLVVGKDVGVTSMHKSHDLGQFFM